MAVNKHSSHRHNVFMNSSASTYWWRFYKDWSEKNHVSLLFGQALLLHLKAFALTAAHHSTTVPRFPPGFYTTTRFLHNTHCLLYKSLTDKTSVPPEPERNISSKLSMQAQAVAIKCTLMEQSQQGPHIPWTDYVNVLWLFTWAILSIA